MYKVINTKGQGILRSKPRAYLVGVRRDNKARKFRFPDAAHAEPMDRFMDDGLTSS